MTVIEASREEAELLGSTTKVNCPVVLSLTLHHVLSELALHDVWLVVTEITELPPFAVMLMVCVGETVSTGCSFSSSCGISTPGSLLQEMQKNKNNITIVIEYAVFIGCYFFDYDYDK